MIEEEPRPVPSKGWAEMIRKIYEVDPLRCPRCGGMMKVVAFLTEYAVVDRIIRHLELTFIAEKPPPAHIGQVALPAAEESGDYEWRLISSGEGVCRRLTPTRGRRYHQSLMGGLISRPHGCRMRAARKSKFFRKGLCG